MSDDADGTTPLTTDRAPDGTLVLAGTLGHRDVPGFEDLLRREVLAGPVTVDLSGVDYLPSLALTSIVKAWKLDGAHPLTLRTAPGTITHRILSITRLPFTES